VLKLALISAAVWGLMAMIIV